MSWMQKLYRTYEYVQEQGLDDEDLALPFHMSKAVHLKVILNDKAEFVGAERFDGKKQVPIQVTEKSSKRAGSAIAPYALHDGLQYIAKTAGNYLTIEYLSKVAEKDNGKKWKEFLAGTDEDKQKFADREKAKYKDCFEFYEKQLSGWNEFGNLKEIKFVLQYIQKGSLIEDLLEKQIFSFKDNILSAGKDDPFSLTIVWAVEISNDLHSDLWNKSCIQSRWIEYQESLIQKGRHKSLCCITGDLDYPTEAYPKINGNAKLVSANDDTGFTFRGRFYGDKDNGDKSELGSQAVILGKNASQKAFSALKWLINRQGIRNGKQVILAWSSNCISDEDELLSNLYQGDDIYTSLFAKDKIDHSADLGLKTVEQLKKKFHGYKEKLAANEQISLLMVDEPSKTGGRMSLTFYQEKLRDDYFRDLDEWQDDFAWYQEYKSSWIFAAPSLERIAEVVLTKTEFEDKDRKSRRQLYARLLPVISGGKSVHIPYDLVQKSFQVACNPFANYRPEDGEKIRSANWQRNICVACALYKGWRARHHNLSQRRTYPMSLDTQNRSRDYIFGRLLAVAEHLERTALRIANETRATNAENYMQRFVMRPFHTWEQLETNLKPYKDRLRKDYPVRISEKFVLTSPIGFLNNRENEINQLICVLDDLKQEGCDLDKPLEPEFLLGYHSQKMAYRNKSNQPEQEVTETHE
ncbi:MAG: type I-C CRISPR-associated protein Cas8c/Csd1 [Aggregatibacter aphrophilus]|uniref:type I-C CRISPR-associated protein Cas8c/Csd1 n=1 Tax=Aggregatibacter aphrophilus TaxID=732 RepID=UPI00290772CE|nr:type I-C CRISPR-associated protein Cas8c/Csd1 [Aggregatibacter aphrophilus]MDU7786455.1 type I-C CRISPR-associated protein Cas8c/Csd1 [Aggregatibacter aphrophilus]